MKREIGNGVTGGALKAAMVGLLALGLAAGVSGCSQTHAIKGKVIPGNLSFVAVVDRGDERLKTEGLADATIEARADVGNVGGFLFGEAKSDAKGDFTMTFKEQGVFLKPVEFTVMKDGMQTARGTMNLPSDQRRLLIIMTPVRANAGAK